MDGHASTSVRVLHRGDVVYTAGPQDVPLPIHSMRKSILSALFGQLVDDGLRLATTLADLGIDDSPALTPIEKSATLEHLLTSRSGVYLPLAFDTSFDVLTGTATEWPGRASSAPGTRFRYNNWDFNALGEIYQRVSGISLFVAIDRLLAAPLGFRDWDPLRDGRLRYASDPLGATSTFPNYVLRLSTRDLATFGQLYLADGEWHGHRIVPADWVRRSTRPVVDTELAEPFGHYGYLWWVSGGGLDSLLPAGAFSAVGIGGQALTVVPDRELVIVAMCDTTTEGKTRMLIPEEITSAVVAFA
jgi:CubicO group peptidase (beta-lactamase class C family)